MPQSGLPSLIINFSFDPFVPYSKIVGANGIYCVLFSTCDDFRTPIVESAKFSIAVPAQIMGDRKSNTLRKSNNKLSLGGDELDSMRSLWQPLIRN